MSQSLIRPGRGTAIEYLAGFVLSIILTTAAFWLVLARPIEDAVATTGAIMALATAQIIVHMICFLHMNAKSQGGWTMAALVFAGLVVTIMLAGSLWVMHHLNANMMPVSADMMRNMP